MAVSRIGAFNGVFPTIASSRTYKPVDMEDPTAHRRGVHNVLNLYDATPEQVRRSGMQWYDRINEATAKGVRGRNMSLEQGAGIVAAVSPGMDWERNNIGAFAEITSLRDRDWDVIQRSAAGDKSADLQAPLKGMSISTAPAVNLMKAHRIMQGEDVGGVLSRLTAPKTSSFARNIAEPGVAGPVTIDGRAYDVLADRLLPWKEDRNIGSASLPSGKPTRYERMEDVYREAAGQVDILPHQMQAVTWEGAKRLERAGVTKAGANRQQGAERRGQPYSSIRPMEQLDLLSAQFGR